MTDYTEDNLLTGVDSQPSSSQPITWRSLD